MAEPVAGVRAEAAELRRALLLRTVRLVPVRTRALTSEPVDVRVRGGVVVEVAPGLRPESAGELVLEADGRWLVPGLWDAHVHLVQWARAGGWLDVSGTASAEEVVARVASYVAALPREATGAVLGRGYRSASWQRTGTVAELDAVSGGRPVVLVAGDSHNGWLNSAALALLGGPSTTGPLTEGQWYPLMARLGELPGVTDGEEEQYRAVVADAAARGVVGVVDLELAAGYHDWPERYARGIDALRVRTATYADRLDEVLAAGLRTGDPLPGGGGSLTMGPLKVISDGSLNTRTACCRDPYVGTAEHGALNLHPDELVELLRRARSGGLHAAVHAIGDAAVATTLDAFAATGVAGSVEHAQLMTADDVRRMGRLRPAVRASVQPAHLLDDRDVAHRLWADRTDRCYPFRSLLDAGVELALGSDAPVSPLDPWLAMAAAVHRSADDRPPWNPAEAITAAEALAASTDGQPTVAPGSRGDLALLDADPLAAGADPPDTAAAAAHLRRAHVAATVVAGRVTHDAR